MGRDVGRDEGREQAEWRDLVARLELQAPVDPKDAPWPDRENLRAKAQADTAGPGAAGPGAAGPGAAGPGAAGPSSVGSGTGTTGSDTDRSRVIRPAGFTKFGGPPEASATASTDDGQAIGPGAGVPTGPGAAGPGAAGPGAAGPGAAGPGAAGPGEPALGGPRDYELDEPGDNDLDEGQDDRYIPPPLPPQPGLDPVAKGAWLALFGGPGYLLMATLFGWQISGWAALTAVIAFISGFVVLVFRLGDGPSKRDGPDQGAVV